MPPPPPPPPPTTDIATRIPEPKHFDHLKQPHQPQGQSLHVSLVYPSGGIPETTTSLMILFHGLGDSEVSFAQLARNLNLPGVAGIAVRGVNPVPAALLGVPPSSSAGSDDGGDGGSGGKHFHWADDIHMDPSTGDLDADPGFAKAQDLVLGGLIKGTLVDKLGWRTEDILLFGFGQGGSLALGLAARLRDGLGSVAAAAGSGDGRVVDVTDLPDEGRSQGGGGDGHGRNEAFKGVVSIGGPLPPSMVSTLSSRPKARTPVLVCHGRNSEAVDEDAMDYIRREVSDVREVKWSKRSSSGDDGMPRNREEMLPIMQFFAERLTSGSP